MSYRVNKNDVDGRTYAGDDNNISTEETESYKSIILSWFTKISLALI